MAGTMVPASGVAAGLRKIDAKLADIERALDGSDLIGAGAETMWLRNRLTALCAALDLTCTVRWAEADRGPQRSTGRSNG